MEGVRLTREQVRRIDAICVEEYGIPGIVLMENAARGLLDAAREMLGESGGERVLIVCGGGNNGGDGYALARPLHNAGCEVTLAAAHELRPLSPRAAAPQEMSDAQINLRICQRMILEIVPATPELIGSCPADLLVDALFGTGLDKPPRPDAAALIRAMNERPEPILAVDLPSGLDCDTGRPLGDAADCIRATRTVTMVAMKAGFGPAARQWTGGVTVADIGCPREVIERVLMAT